MLCNEHVCTVKKPEVCGKLCVIRDSSLKFAISYLFEICECYNVNNYIRQIHIYRLPFISNLRVQWFFYLMKLKIANHHKSRIV